MHSDLFTSHLSLIMQSFLYLNLTFVELQLEHFATHKHNGCPSPTHATFYFAYVYV